MVLQLPPQHRYFVYGIYLFLLIILVGSILATPLLALMQDSVTPGSSESGLVGISYRLFAATCHQKISRSLCIFRTSGLDGNGGLSTSYASYYWIGDCTPQEGQFYNTNLDKDQIRVDGVDASTNTHILGYKMPVCARDFGLYGAMLLGALVYPIMRDLKERKVWPAVYLMLAIVPIALDGSVQLVSEFGVLPFVYESSNLMRLLTGAIAGFVASFYVIALLMNMIGKDEKEKTQTEHTNFLGRLQKAKMKELWDNKEDKTWERAIAPKAA